MKPLTRARALVLVHKKWGARGFITDATRKRGMSSEAQRQGASDALKTHRFEEPKFTPLHDWPAETTIGEYRAALAAYKAAHRVWAEREKWLLGHAMYRRISVGYSMHDLGFIQGSGDTLEEALTKAGIVIGKKEKR